MKEYTVSIARYETFGPNGEPLTYSVPMETNLSAKSPMSAAWEALPSYMRLFGDPTIDDVAIRSEGRLPGGESAFSVWVADAKLSTLSRVYAGIIVSERLPEPEPAPEPAPEPEPEPAFTAWLHTGPTRLAPEHEPDDSN